MATLSLHPTPDEIKAYYRKTSREAYTSIGTMGNATVSEVINYLTVRMQARPTSAPSPLTI